MVVEGDQQEAEVEVDVVVEVEGGEEEVEVFRPIMVLLAARQKAMKNLKANTEHPSKISSMPS